MTLREIVNNILLEEKGTFELDLEEIKKLLKEFTKLNKKYNNYEIEYSKFEQDSGDGFKDFNGEEFKNKVVIRDKYIAKKRTHNLKIYFVNENGQIEQNKLIASRSGKTQPKATKNTLMEIVNNYKTYSNVNDNVDNVDNDTSLEKELEKYAKEESSKNFKIKDITVNNNNELIIIFNYEGIEEDLQKTIKINHSNKDLFKLINKSLNKKQKEKVVKEVFKENNLSKKNVAHLMQEVVQQTKRVGHIEDENKKNNLPQTAQEAVYTILKNGIIRLTDEDIKIFETGVLKNKNAFENISKGLDGFIKTPQGNILFIEDKSSNAKTQISQTSEPFEGVKKLPSKIHENNSNVWTVAVLTGNGYNNILNKLEKNEKYECRVKSRKNENKWYPGINHYELFNGNKNNWTYAVTSEIDFDKMLDELMTINRLKVQNMYENSNEISKYIKETFKNSNVYNNKGELVKEEVSINTNNTNIIKDYAMLCISLATLKKYKKEAGELLNKLNFKLDNAQPRNFKLDNNRQIEQKINKFNRDVQAWNLQTRKYNSQKKAKEEISSIETKYFNY